MAPDSGEQLDPLDLLQQPGPKPTGQGRIERGVVGHDGVKILLNPGMEDQPASGQFQREPVRASNPSQVRPIDGSSCSSAARDRIIAFCCLVTSMGADSTVLSMYSTSSRRSSRLMASIADCRAGITMPSG
jgi:hypothetical protein